MDIQPRNTLLMIGDSITDCGRARPIGESYMHDGLGHGYVNIVQAALAACYPEYAIRVINMGISGNTVRDLKSRWQSDVLDLQPNWLSIMIGINDVWRHFQGPATAQRHVPLPEYAQTLEDLVRQARPTLQGLVLMTPYFIESQSNDPMRAMMDRYGAAVREIATRYEARFVDTQAAFNATLRWLHPMQLAADRVHPNTPGHMILARAFLSAIGFDWTRVADGEPDAR